MTEHPAGATGAIVDADAQLRHLHTILSQYVGGAQDAYTAAAMVQRVATQLDRACWCDHDVCCGLHRQHVSPHRRCPLR